jgi:hypothetical protein
MSSPSSDYVKRALDRLAEKARENASAGIQRIHRENTAVGRLESGITLIQSNDAMLALMKTSINEGISLVFNAFEKVTPEGIWLLQQFSSTLEKVLAAPVWQWAKIGDPTATIKLKMAKELDARLAEVSAAAIDDFEHGMTMGGLRLKKDPAVSIVNNMVNSPGAVQQAGIGDGFSQSAFTDQSNNLVRAIDHLLTSAEFQKLDQDKQDEIADVAHSLKQEAMSDNPDPGRLKRWGLKLSALTKAFGLHVAAAGLWHALGEIFSGVVAF